MIVKVFSTREEAEAFAAKVDASLGYPKQGRFPDGTLAPRGQGETLRHNEVYRSATITTNARGETSYVWQNEWYYVVEGEVAAVDQATKNIVEKDVQKDAVSDSESKTSLVDGVSDLIKN